jgi:hypothetical protein
MGWTGLVLCMGEMRCAQKILFGKFEKERAPRRHRHRWYNIKVCLNEIGCERLD